MPCFTRPGSPGVVTRTATRPRPSNSCFYCSLVRQSRGNHDISAHKISGNGDALSEITLLLQLASGGDSEARGQLTPLVYGELRRLAAAQLRYERAGQSLQC